MKGPTPNLTHEEELTEIILAGLARSMQPHVDKMIREDEHRLLFGDGSQHSLTGIIHTEKAKK